MHRTGFTLLEVLVTVSVIGILASIVAANLGSARMLARDARRKADAAQIRTALELYYNDHDQYPAIGYAQSNPPNLGWSALQQALTPYISLLPAEPANSILSGYRYRSLGEGSSTCIHQWYVLEFQLESTNDPMLDQAGLVRDCIGTMYPDDASRSKNIVGLGVSKE